MSVVQSRARPDRQHAVEGRRGVVAAPQGEETEGAELVEVRVVGRLRQGLAGLLEGPVVVPLLERHGRAASKDDTAGSATASSGRAIVVSIGWE